MARRYVCRRVRPLHVGIRARKPVPRNVLRDVQNGFVSDVSRPVIPVIRELVSRWQRNGEQTVFARYLNYPGSQFERLIKRSKLQESPETDIVDELAPLAAKPPQ